MSWESVVLSSLIQRINAELLRLQQQLENGPNGDIADQAGMSYARQASKIATLRSVLEWIDETEKDLTTNNRDTDGRAGRSVPHPANR